MSDVEVSRTNGNVSKVLFFTYNSTINLALMTKNGKKS